MSSTGNNDEMATIIAIRQLDQQALAEVFDTYYDPIYGYIFRRVHQKKAAEDLTSEVFRKLLEQITAGKGPEKYLKAYLYRIAQNLIIDRSRRNKHRDHEPLDEWMNDDAESVHTQAQKRIQFEQAREAMGKLDARQQAVITLKFLEGLSNQEIAHVLKMTIPTVKALQHRGLNSLREHLTPSGIMERIG